MAAPASDACDNSLPSTATNSKCPSPASCTPPETPLAPLRLSAANRSLLVRVLNRNLAQQQLQDTALQSLGSDPLLNALPAGSPLSYPNSATARMAAEQAWLASESQTPYRPDSRDDRSPVTPASTLLSSPDSPTTVLLRAAESDKAVVSVASVHVWECTFSDTPSQIHLLSANATAPPPPTPASWSEPCTPSEALQSIHRAASSGDVQISRPDSSLGGKR